MKQSQLLPYLLCLAMPVTALRAEESENNVADPVATSLPEPAFSQEFRPEAVLEVLEKVAAKQKNSSLKAPGPVFSTGWQAFAKISKEAKDKNQFADSKNRFWNPSAYGVGFLPFDKVQPKAAFGGVDGARKLAGLALYLETLPKSNNDKVQLIDALIAGVAAAREHQNASGLWGPDYLATTKGQNPDMETSALVAFVRARGVNESYGMMWLDSARVAVIRTWRNLVRCIGPEGEIRISSPENAGFCSEAAGAFLLAGAEVFRLAKAMQEPVPFVTSEEYRQDLETQKKAIAEQPPVTRKATLQAMRKVSTWQLDHLFHGSAGDAQAAERSWFRGAFLAGVVVAARETQDEAYWDLARKISEENQWQPGPNVLHDGNDLAITQTYLAFYLRDRKNTEWIKPTRDTMDALAAKAQAGRKEWSWADTLFMAPAAWAQMSLATGEPNYRDRMNRLWWDAIDLLLDKEEGLVFRDHNFMPQADGFQIRERNGKKIFWGRGNGWVVGGLCNVLEALPSDYPERPKYEKLLATLCASLAERQGADGLWRASLLDPDSYPLGETSGSTFFCYAIAWGINHGVLDREKYVPVASKAWRGLMACVEPDGKLGYVQFPAESPRSPTYRSQNVEYAAGAFLAAGAEMLTLLR